MSDASQKIRARARLALRAEKAFGLDALPIRLMPAPAIAAIAVSTNSIAPTAIAENRTPKKSTPPPSIASPSIAARVTAPASIAQSPRVELVPATKPISLPKSIPQPQPVAPVKIEDTPAFVAPAVVTEARKSVVSGFAAPGAPMALLSTVPFTQPTHSSEEKRRLLAELDANEVKGCPRCRLCETRTHTVFGEGDPDAKIMFIGEGPGENEDLQGRPFIGRAGDLLNKMIGGMGLKREQVFIVNIVKCRPPGNREPAPDEVAACAPYLEKQIEIIRPRVIVTLGRPALAHMLQQKIAISKMRGQWQTWRGIRLMPTFHPAFVLRNYTEQTRSEVWSDLQQVMAELGLKTPAR